MKFEVKCIANVGKAPEDEPQVLASALKAGLEETGFVYGPEDKTVIVSGVVIMPVE